MTRHDADRGRLIYEAIRDFAAEYGYPPTVRELALSVGLASASGVQHHIDRLVRAGLVTRDPERARTLRITEGGTWRT